MQGSLQKRPSVLTARDVVGDKDELLRDGEFVCRLQGGRAAPGHPAFTAINGSGSDRTLEDGHGDVAGEQTREAI